MRTTNTLLMTIAALALATTPAALAAIPTDIEPSATLAPATATTDLVELARVFGETPGSTRSDNFDSSSSCGLSGHCNLVGCPDPGCPSGWTPAYQCTVTTIVCEDTHDWYNPFDNDEHNMYDCSSSCTQDEEEEEPQPECLVGNPTGPGCIIEKPACAPLLETPSAVNFRYDGAVPPGLGMNIGEGSGVPGGGINC